MGNRSNDVRAPEPVQLIRCNSCRAPISAAISRCPYCGQLTTGTERTISQFELELQRREKIAERKHRFQCKLCGKILSANAPLCAQCEAADKRKTRLLLVLFCTVVIAIVWFFS